MAFHTVLISLRTNSLLFCSIKFHGYYNNCGHQINVTKYVFINKLTNPLFYQKAMSGRSVFHHHKASELTGSFSLPSQQIFPCTTYSQ